MKAYIGLGSNIGDRRKNLLDAVDLLEDRVHITGYSSIYECEPVGFVDQPDFLNAVVVVEGDFTPDDLFMRTKEIEDIMGKVKIVNDGPRKIDLDILLVDEIEFYESDLQIPHPRMHERLFVLVPLCEIDEGIWHPVLKKTCGQLLAELERRPRIKRIGGIEA